MVEITYLQCFLCRFVNMLAAESNFTVLEVCFGCSLQLMGSIQFSKRSEDINLISVEILLNTWREENHRIIMFWLRFIHELVCWMFFVDFGNSRVHADWVVGATRVQKSTYGTHQEEFLWTAAGKVSVLCDFEKRRQINSQPWWPPGTSGWGHEII